MILLHPIKSSDPEWYTKGDEDKHENDLVFCNAAQGFSFTQSNQATQTGTKGDS